MKPVQLSWIAAAFLGLSPVVQAGFDGAISDNSLRQVGESEVYVPFFHSKGKAGIGSATGKRVDFDGLAGNIFKSKERDNVHTVGSKHFDTSHYNFVQVANQDIWFGEWYEGKQDADFNNRTVYYVGNDAGTTVPTSGTATYNITGINKFSGSNKLSGTFDADFNNQTLIKVYQQYDDHCNRAGLVDFAEMLLRAHELLLNNEDVLHKYQMRFSHILVDEFQDTNSIQSAFIQLLAGKNNKVLVVGDDDQSIYAWRGAKVDHILDYQTLNANTALYKLEQNYRSTQTILDAANGVIKNNNKRLGKNLWSAQEKGEPVSIYGSHSEFDEAFYVGETIDALLANTTRPDDICILYRSNAQSRLLEEALIKRQIPYQIYGGLRFFERMEIKDVMAYARLVNNRHDDIGFERVINTPTRGLGLKTINMIRNYAAMNQSSLWQAGLDLVKQSKLANRAATSFAAFANLIDELQLNNQDQPLAGLFADIIERTSLKDHYLKEPPEKAQTRLENLDELLNAGETFEISDQDLELGLTPLSSFLAAVSLDAGDRDNKDEPHVQLMTLHSAKGLEFPVVFIVGLEQGLFPHQNSMEDLNKLQEERRLAYVGITRAEKQLFLSYATSRRIRGKISPCQPSQFLREIPKELTKQQRGNIHPSRPSSHYGQSTPYQQQTKPDNDSPYRIGQNVTHQSFGEGVITDMSGKGDYLQVLVQFNQVGPKVLAAKFAKLTII